MDAGSQRILLPNSPLLRGEGQGEGAARQGASVLEMNQNVELKARLADPDRARAVALRLRAVWQWTAQQTDTYFRAPDGSRMKLRETDGQPAALITYRRPNRRGPRTSTYRIEPVSDPDQVRAKLAARYGVDVVVTKVRELWLLEGTRIHLDEVEGLGCFIEFEIVLAVDTAQKAARHRSAILAHAFGLAPADYVPGSYADLVRAFSVPP